MAFEFYKAQLPIQQTPQEDWEESYQQGLDSYWENTSTVAIIQSQTAIGVKTYADENVQLNSVIKPTTGEKFGDYYRKLIHKTYKTVDNYLGKMYQFDNKTWLTINTDTIIGSLKTSIVRYCNNFLKWIDKNGILHSWECTFDTNLKGTKYDEGTEGVPQIKADAVILVQRNEFTNLIPYNQRFIFDGYAFQTQQIDNHFSQSYMIFYLFATQIQEGDDLINNIANASELEPMTTEQKILPQTVKILQGKAQVYNIYNYVDGIKNADTFTVTTSQAPTANYVLTIIDGNNYSIKNNTQTPIPLIVECKNDTTQEVATMTIKLGGLF